MGNLKPLGSEKLQGDEKLKRILELTYYGNKPRTPEKNNFDYITETINGVYGIVKEKDGYYVKKGLNESSLDYIGGMFMKNKNKFSSYAEALKRLQLISGQDIQEATKYVLKQPSSDTDTSSSVSAESPSEMPAEMPVETPAESPSEMPAEMPVDEPESNEKPSDYMSEIQKFSGKLGQELRDQKEKMESDDIKYVLNMIISAVNLDKLDDDDIEEIGKKFDRDEEYKPETPEEEPETPEEEPETPEEEPETPEDEDLSETMGKLEKFVNTPISTDEEIDLRKYALGEEDIDPSSSNNKQLPKYGGYIGNNPMKNNSNNEDDIHEIDLDEIKKEINNSINSTLGKYFK